MVSIRRNNGYPPFILLTPDHTTTLGKIIISEQCLPENKKTIHPTSMGGFIGGDKYLIPSGIVFKVKPRPRRSPLTNNKVVKENDTHFDSFETAAKVAGHDLKGLSAYFNANQDDDLCFPMMVSLDPNKTTHALTVSLLFCFLIKKKKRLS